MAQGTILGQTGGSSKINGIIEEYKVASGGNVNAGDFVRFIMEKEESTQIVNGCGEAHSYSFATQLSNNKILFTYNLYNNNSNYLYGIVIQINNNTIEVGIATQISSLSGSGYYAGNIQLLTENKVFIVMGTQYLSASISDQKYNYLYGVVCQINNNTITPGTVVKLSSEYYSAYRFKSMKLSNDKILIVHTLGSNFSLYGTLCKIEGLTVSVENTNYITAGSSNVTKFEIISINNNSFFIPFCYSSNTYLYGIVIKVNDSDSGSVIEVGTSIQISSYTQSGNYNWYIIEVSENKFFINFTEYSSSRYYLYGIICQISNFDILLGTRKDLASGNESHSYAYNRLFKIVDDKILILAGLNAINSSNYYLYAILCNINENSIITQKTQLSSDTSSGNAFDILRLSNNKFFIEYTGSSGTSNVYFSCGLICEINNDIITTGPDTLLTTNIYNQAIQLYDNQIFIIVCTRTGSGNYLDYTFYGILFNVNNICLIQEYFLQLNTISSARPTKVSCIKLSNDKMLVNYGAESEILGQICNFGVSKVDGISGAILGVSKKSGASEQMVQVYVPNIEEGGN